MFCFLQEAKKVSIDQDLKTLLSETPGRCVPYAVIEGVYECVTAFYEATDSADEKLLTQRGVFLFGSGVVRSVKETLSSQFVDNCKGVIERLTLKEEKMVWNRTTHIW